MTPDDADLPKPAPGCWPSVPRCQANWRRLRARLETKGDYGLGEGDPMIYQWELNLALCKRAEQHLAEIEEALEQLDMGIYGRCERCGKPIEPERLAVLPHTTVCSQCAQRRR